MGDYKVKREKLVKYQGVLIDARADGSVHIQVSGKSLDLDEAEFLAVHDVIDDVTEWDGNKGHQHPEGEDG